MSFQRVHQSRSQNPQTSSSTSQFAPRPFPVQEPKRPPTQEEIENEVFQQNKFEAFGLQLKEKHGTITPVEQEKLWMLQAKMDSFWAQRMERPKAQPNLLEILIRNAQTAQTTEPSAPVQPKLTVGQPNDQYEQEADRVAEQVMSMTPSATPNIQQQAEEEQEEVQAKPLVETITPIVQRQEALEEDEPIQAKCENCEEEEQVQRSPNGVPQVQTDLESRLNASKSGGSPLPDEVRSFMEPRFGADFSRVRVHTDTNAAQMNDALSARALTYGSDIYLNRGEYNTVSTEGKRLLAHELTHVIQQHTGRVNTKIQRDCSDPDFCKPYTTATEIADAKAYLMDYFVPVLEAYFGSDVGALWRRYLSRKPGASLTPAVFNTEGNSIHDSFSDNNYIHDETDHVLDLVASRLSRGYGNVTQPITNFLSSSEMELNTNFANPFTIPGNIAGGIGPSDAGMDSRRITWGHVSFDITNLPFGGKLVNIEVTLGFEVKDTVDLCPGDCGAILEQTLATIKMSRLEASGEAYDVPFIVRFTGPTKNKRVID